MHLLNMLYFQFLYHLTKKKKKNWFAAAKSHGKHKKSCMKCNFIQLFLGPTTMENLDVGNCFPLIFFHDFSMVSLTIFPIVCPLFFF